MDRLQPGNFYHIFHRGKDRENIFREQRNYQFFYRRFLFYTKKHFEIYAYCLMSNHYHFVVFIKDYIVLNEIQDFKLLPHEKAIKNFLISYSKSFNKLYGSSGGVFYPNYRRNHIHNEDYLKNAILYTHLNPAKHRIYRNYENYAHSSYQTILQGSSEMVKYNEVIKLFGSKEEFVDAHKQAFGKLDDNNDFFERD